MNKNNKNLIYIIGFIVVGIIILSFSGGKINTNKEINSVIEIRDDSKKTDESLKGWSDSEKNIFEDEKINNLSEFSRRILFVEDDGTNLKIIRKFPDEKHLNYSRDEFVKKYIGDLKENERITQLWLNTQFSKDGFQENFKAIMIENIETKKFKLFWSVGEENFIIQNLDKKKFSEMNREIIVQGHRYLSLDTSLTKTKIMNKLNLGEEDYFYKIGESGTESGDNIYTTLIFINDKGELYLLKEVYNEVSGNINFKTYSTKTYVLSDVQFEHTLINNNFELDRGAESKTLALRFSIANYEEFSSHTIAQNKQTRSQGFNKVSVLNDYNLDTRYLGESKLNIFSAEKFKESLELSKSQNYINDFEETNILNILKGVEDKNLAVYEENFLDYINLGLGQSNSEDLSNIQGVSLSGSIVEKNEVDFLEMKSFVFDDLVKTKGLNFFDDGLIKIYAQNTKGTSYGKFVFDSDTDYIKTNGESYFIGVSNWDKVFSSILNIFDFSFPYSSWLTEKETNAVYGVGDSFNECDINSKCQYLYSTSFKNDRTNNIVVGNSETQETLNFGEKKFKTLWKLSDKNKNPLNYGCIVFEEHNSVLGSYIPVSVCGQELIGILNDAQFKIKNSN